MFEELFHQRGLSLERLHALVQLGEEGSLIRAAKGDSGLQSRYSHHLKELASYFGVEITERIGKTIRLTGDGERLVRLTREQFQNLLQFKKEVQGRAPAFRLGAADSLLQWLVIPAIAALRRPKGNVQFVLQNLGVEEIVSRLDDQRLDFGLAASDAPLKGLTTKSVCRVRHIIVVPDRIGARRGMLTLRQALLDCPHASLKGDSALRQAIEQIAHGFGRHFEPELQCDSVSQCVAAVQTGHFAAVVPLWSWDPSTSIPHAICEDPKLDELDRNLVVIWHPRLMTTRGPSAKQVSDSLAALLSAQGISTKEKR
jgi:DNA-binding transcriptional LysR family regulator